MNLSILLFTIANLAQVSNSHQPSNYEKHPACNAINKIIYQATNKECLFVMPDKEACFAKHEDVLYTPPVVNQINLFTAQCKKELASLYPAKIHEELIRNRAKIDCNRQDLDTYEAYFCEQTVKDIEDLEKHLNQR